MSDAAVESSEVRHATGRRCRACGTDVVSWLEDATSEERTDKAVSVACATPRCFSARQPLLGLGLYASTVEELLQRIGAIGEPPAP